MATRFRQRGVWVPIMLTLYTVFAIPLLWRRWKRRADAAETADSLSDGAALRSIFFDLAGALMILAVLVLGAILIAHFGPLRPIHEWIR